MAKRSTKATTDGQAAESYAHPESKALLRPDVGTQAQFKKRKEPARYRYDSSLSPALDWDGGNAARELGEWLIRCVDEASKLAAPHEFEKPREMRTPDGSSAVVRGLRDAVEQLKRQSKPFLACSGYPKCKNPKSLPKDGEPRAESDAVPAGRARADEVGDAHAADGS